MNKPKPILDCASDFAGRALFAALTSPEDPARGMTGLGHSVTMPRVSKALGRTLDDGRHTAIESDHMECVRQHIVVVQLQFICRDDAV